MKYLILVAALLLAGCDYSKLTVVCVSPFSPTGVEVFTPEQVSDYAINSTGTTIWLNDGSRVEYPPGVQCKGTITR